MPRINGSDTQSLRNMQTDNMAIEDTLFITNVYVKVTEDTESRKLYTGYWVRVFTKETHTFFLIKIIFLKLDIVEKGP